MKKTLIVILAAVLLFTVAACGKKKADPAPSEGTAGGWTINTGLAESAIPEDVAEAFKTACSDIDGEAPEAVAYLGSQVVAGANYAFLTKSGSALELSIVYKDLEGNASFLKREAINLLDYVNTNSTVEASTGSAGGWNIAADNQAKLDDNLQKAFDKAFDGFTGVGYRPIASLGTQVVAGTNYAVLCATTAVTNPPASGLAVVTIYADLQGGAEITGIANFPIAQ